MNRIHKITSISEIGAFSDFYWKGDKASKYNLIYGWNASGKTTISRILRFLEVKEVDLDGFDPVNFRLATDDGPVTEKHLASEKLNIRVFNEDFVEENLSFHDSRAASIVILGKSSVDAEKKIDKFQAKREKADQNLERINGRLDELPDLKQILTDCGRAVVREFAGTPLASEQYDGRSYTRTNVENRLHSGDVTSDNLHSLIVDDPPALSTLRDRITDQRSELTIPDISTDRLKQLFWDANKLLTLNVETEVIDRLEEDNALRSWIATGHDLHKERDTTECLFCEQPLPDGLLKRYDRYFTEEAVKAEKELKSVSERLKANKARLNKDLPDSSDLFPDLRDSYVKEKEVLNQTVTQLDSLLDGLLQRLDQREGRIQITESQQQPISFPQELVNQIDDTTSTLNKIATKHNKRLGQKDDDDVARAAEQLELHHIASVLSKKDYFAYKDRKRELQENLQGIARDIEKYESIIRQQKAEMRDTHIAVAEINSVIADFLGEGEIELRVADHSDDDKDPGYELTSDGEPIKYLSDGEKSVVALAYFLVSLQEEARPPLEESIIIIDDPVDSQDSLFLYRTFGLLKRHLYHAGQVFMLTHNYDLFNLLRDWLTSSRFRSNSELYHITLRRGDKRTVTVSELPALLRNFQTEYHFLFSKLYEYRNNPDLAEGPVIPNLARKVLEHFAAFKWSCRKSEDFASIVHTRFITSENKQKQAVGDAVVKFLHQHSHGEEFDRPVTASVMEAEDICKNILKFIYLCDEDHYDNLVQEIERHESEDESQGDDGASD